MTLELASERIVRKPWGKTDLHPWSDLGQGGSPIGELWFQRADQGAPDTALLLKLLFTDERLSVQVHPDDDLAKAVGLPHGKTEAWYVLSAEPGAEVALGLNHSLTASQLRAAIEDATIPDLIHWQSVEPGEALLVPAGTIHAIGAGLVLAEIQQRSDATFRLFDYGRKRALHLDGAVAAAIAGPAAPQLTPERLTECRMVLATSPHFVLEKVELPADSQWEVDAESETWLLVLDGEVQIEQLSAKAAQAVFIDDQRVAVRTGAQGLKGLLAYVAREPSLERLRSHEDRATVVPLPDRRQRPAPAYLAPHQWRGRS